MPPWRQHYAELSAVLAGVERWLLPASCLLCSEPVSPARPGEEAPLVCGLCRLRWRPVPPPVCSRCGQPESGGSECLICRDWPPGLCRVRSAVWLDGQARQAVHRLKYGGWWRLAEAMADAMRTLEPLGQSAYPTQRSQTWTQPLEPRVPASGPLTRQVFLVPVPLGPKRLRRRGYNQSERLAAALGRGLGLPVRPELLTRMRETGTQTALTPEARQANVRGAFQVGRALSESRRRPGHHPHRDRPSPAVSRDGTAEAEQDGGSGAEGRHLVLVDDVFTTGATLIAAASALTDAGAARVEAVTFARAAPPIMNL